MGGIVAARPSRTSRDKGALPEEQGFAVPPRHVAQGAVEHQHVLQQAGRRGVHYHAPQDVWVVIAQLAGGVRVRALLQDAVRVDDELSEDRMEGLAVAQ